MADVVFLLDSSGSMTSLNYQKEKDFLKSIATKFVGSKYQSRIGLITFSNVAEYSIKLKDATDIASFKIAIDSIPLMGTVTRIDKALQLAQKIIFDRNTGARPAIPKVLVLLTNGYQTQEADTEDPAVIANELRKAGISIIVLGIGSSVKKGELTGISGSSLDYYNTPTFDDLLSDAFIKSAQDAQCIGMVYHL